MTIEQAISEIASLPLDDQRAELDRRLAAYRANPDSALSESQLRKQIRDAGS